MRTWALVAPLAAMPLRIGTDPGRRPVTSDPFDATQWQYSTPSCFVGGAERVAALKLKAAGAMARCQMGIMAKALQKGFDPEQAPKRRNSWEAKQDG